MSFVEIQTKTSVILSPTPDNSDDTFELPDDDYLEGRCGEIFISHEKNLVFICSLCDCKYAFFDDFLLHISGEHYHDNEEEHPHVEVEENYDCNEDCEPYIDLNALDIPEVKEEKETDYAPNEVKCAEETYFVESLNIPKTEPQSLREESYDEDWDTHNADVLDVIEEYIDDDDDIITEVTESPIEEPEVEELIEYIVDENADACSNNSSQQCNSSYRIINDHEDKKQSQPNEALKCKICNQIFSTQAKLRVHTTTHSSERKYKCDQCGFAFKELFNLNTHVRRHKGIKPYSCQFCGKQFTTRTEMNSHRRCHTGERPYICEICGNGFPTSGSLSEHKKRHSNYRAHKCDECGKGFFDNYLLKEHQAIHSGVRSHVCSVCSAAFTRRKYLLVHMKLHSSVKEYVCVFCKKEFAQKPGLVAHMKTHKKSVGL